MTETLVFEIHKDGVLNANRKLHPMVQRKYAADLRALGAEHAKVLHPESSIAQVEARLMAIAAKDTWALKKKRLKASLKKKNPQLTDREAGLQAEEQLAGEKPSTEPESIAVEHLYHYYRVTVTVQPPTARRLDPPNLYPTVKPLVDGFTDAAIWEDDDFNHMDELSFRYGGKSGIKDFFRLTFAIQEVTRP